MKYVRVRNKVLFNSSLDFSKIILARLLTLSLSEVPGEIRASYLMSFPKQKIYNFKHNIKKTN